MNIQDELDKIDFFKRTKFKGFSPKLSRPITKKAKEDRKEGDR